MKKINYFLFLSLGIMLLLTSCEKWDLKPESSKSASVESQSTNDRWDMYNKQAVEGEYNDKWVASKPEGTKMVSLNGDSWILMAGTAYQRHELAAANGITRGVGGTDFTTNEIFTAHTDSLHEYKIAGEIFHLSTNDIGLYGKLDTAAAEAFFARRRAKFPDAHFFIALCEPHPKHIARGFFPAILEANAYLRRWVARDTKAGHKSEILDTYTLFSLPGASPVEPHPDTTLYNMDPLDRLHPNVAGLVKLSSMFVSAMKRCEGKLKTKPTNPPQDTTTTPPPIVDTPLPPPFNPFVSSNKIPTSSAKSYYKGAWREGTITTTISSGFPELNGNLSKDPDGWIPKYEWIKVSGPSCTITPIVEPSGGIAGRARITNYKPGTYKFWLKVTDNKNAYSYSQLIINIY